MKPLAYFVKTWDWERHEFTPQEGVSVGPYSLMGLRAALRKLKTLGYDAKRGDNSTLVYREDVPDEPGDFTPENY